MYLSGATHAIIANPDVSFTETCVEGMIRVFCHAPDVGVVAAAMEDAPDSYYQDKTAVYVDTVHGSMLMVDCAAFTVCGRYDEGIFYIRRNRCLAGK